MKKKMLGVFLAAVAFFVMQGNAEATNVQFFDYQDGNQVGSMQVNMNFNVRTMSWEQVDNQITVETPTRDGYEFDTWTTEDTQLTLGEGTISINWANPMQDMFRTTSVFGAWNPIDYNITYIDAEGAENPASYNIETETFTLNNPTKDGYTFVGWMEDGEELGTEVTIEQGSMGEREFTAMWEPIVYHITYELDGGSANNPEEYTAESEDFTLNNPTKDGFEFIGWQDEEGNDLGTEVTIPTGSFGDKVFVATWKKIEEAKPATSTNNPATADSIVAYVILFAASASSIVLRKKILFN